MTASEEYEPSDVSPDAGELESIAALRPYQIQAIDEALISVADGSGRKLAFIVGSAMGDTSSRVPGIPDAFYVQRVDALVLQGRLESRGDASRMQYCEIRLRQAD
ncbi:hypothetical protein FHW12_003248 [Dokdonella fugitiva]|uniref:DUF3658 domain-containing protein n=1 Tax=Dokdonella fugitiva TaxID=328517 RepID=A0A839F4P0_9GAMM|nr:DUF3658 domain-containing protein [Dokdonella fugitiva]MBA8889012.1 hypothetical protein [Dokdonella fugitiva]